MYKNLITPRHLLAYKIYQITLTEVKKNLRKRGKELIFTINTSFKTAKTNKNKTSRTKIKAKFWYSVGRWKQHFTIGLSVISWTVRKSFFTNLIPLLQ